MNPEHLSQNAYKIYVDTPFLIKCLQSAIGSQDSHLINLGIFWKLW